MFGMSLTKGSKESLVNMIKQALQKVAVDEDFEQMTDFHFHLTPETGELTLADDDYKVLGSQVVDEWVEADDDTLKTIAHSLTSLLQQMHHDKDFDSVKVFKPFSFVLEDDDKETIEELFIVDDDNICLTDNLLKGMDRELDDFFDQLMKEQ